MTDTTARLDVGKGHFEIMVDMDSAMKLKKGEDVDISEVLRDNEVWTDLKKGLRPAKDEIENAFGTTNINVIVEKIVKKGTMEVTQEFRDEAVEQKRKQIIDFLVRNAVDTRTGNPFTPDVIESSLKQSGARIDKQPIEKQMKGIMEGLVKIIPIKIETKKIKVIIPAMHTGKSYGIINEYKESENWLGNGDLEAVLNIPVGVQMDFYDKLNDVTHGSAVTSEMKVEE